MFGRRGHAGILLSAVILASAVPAGAQSPDPLAAALAHLQNDRYAAAQSEALKVAAAAEGRRDQRLAGRAYNVVADAFYYLARRDEAQRYYGRALEAFRTLGDVREIGRSYYNLSFYYERTDPQKMVDLLNEAEPFIERSGDVRLRMQWLNGRGTAHWSVGHYDAAAADFRAAATIAEAEQDLRNAGVAYQNIGLTLVERGVFDEAAAWLERARALTEKTGNRRALATTLGNLGSVYQSVGEPEKAERLYEQSLAIYRELDIPRGQATQLASLGDMRVLLGDRAGARTLWQQALDVRRKSGDLQGVVEMLVTIVEDAIEAGYLVRAAEGLREASAGARAVKNREHIAEVESLEARLAGLHGARDRVGPLLASALAHARAAGDRFQIGRIHAENGRWDEREQPAAALAAYQRAIAEHRAIGARTDVHLWHAAAARLLARLGRPAEAEREFRAARGVIAELERAISADAFHLGLFREVSHIFQSYAAFLVERQQPEAAWQVIEDGRARTLRMRLRGAGRSAGLSPEQRDALAHLTAVQRRLREPGVSDADRTGLLTRLSDGEAAYDAAGRRAGTLRAEETAPPAFPQRTIVISYSIGPEELLVLKHEGGVSTARRVRDVGHVLDQVRFFATRAAVAQPIFEEAALARTLYDLLLGPELATTAGTRLLIVPDGVLFDLPFAALVDPEGRFLIERRIVSLAPSLGTLATIDAAAPAARRTRSLLAVAATTFEGTLPNGNPLPDLPSAEREAKAIAALSRRADVRTNVSEESFKSAALGDYPVVHLATHIVADATRADRSAIILGSGGDDDGLLQAREIYGLSLPVDLAVISGCSSGRGRVVAGEGVLGLSHALFSAGARALVLSLWAVGDRATASFMEDFYTQLRDHPIDEALAAAQRAVLADPARRHPAHWAAFFVSGNSGASIALPRPMLWGWISMIAAIVFLVWLLVVLRRLIKHDGTQPAGDDTDDRRRLK